MKQLYRYEDSKSYERENVQLRVYNVLSETEKYFVIDKEISSRGGAVQNKRVRKNGKNIYAWRCKRKALWNYVARKERQIKLLEDNLGLSRIRLDQAKTLLKVIGEGE